jgi:hypothetical protein
MKGQWLQNLVVRVCDPEMFRLSVLTEAGYSRRSSP